MKDERMLTAFDWLCVLALLTLILFLGYMLGRVAA